MERIMAFVSPVSSKTGLTLAFVDDGRVIMDAFTALLKWLFSLGVYITVFFFLLLDF